MTALSRPGVLASVMVMAAVLLHPASRSAAWLPGRDTALAALVLLVAVALVLRAAAAPASRRLAVNLLAAGAVLVVVALAADGLRGHRGTLSLTPGQASTTFDEIGPDGRSMGLRPLGFPIGLDRTMPGSALELAVPGQVETVVLTPDRAVSARGFRLSRPRTVTTGVAARLRLGISGGGEDLTVDVVPGQTTRAGDLAITLEEYYPDFALDERQQPFTRSREPLNPAALLIVESPRGTFRVFVLRAMPGVHRVEALDRSFALRAVEPELSAEMEVHRQPFAAAVLLGALLVLAGVVLDRRDR